jgi:hypothetical protein
MELMSSEFVERLKERIPVISNGRHLFYGCVHMDILNEDKKVIKQLGNLLELLDHFLLSLSLINVYILTSFVDRTS